MGAQSESSPGYLPPSCTCPVSCCVSARMDLQIRPDGRGGGQALRSRATTARFRAGGASRRHRWPGRFLSGAEFDAAPIRSMGAWKGCGAGLGLGGVGGGGREKATQIVSAADRGSYRVLGRPASRRALAQGVLGVGGGQDSYGRAGGPGAARWAAVCILRRPVHLTTFCSVASRNPYKLSCLPCGRALRGAPGRRHADGAAERGSGDQTRACIWGCPSFVWVGRLI